MSLIVIGIVAIALIFYLSSLDKNATPKDSIRLSINPFPGTDYAFIALEKKFFEKNGVSVDLILNAAYTDTVEQFEGGYVDGAFEVFTDAIIQNSKGFDVAVVYVTDYSTDGDVIVGKVEDITQLAGKIVGRGEQNFSYFFVVDILEEYGLDEEDVELKIIDETHAVDALDLGIVDAVHTWDPEKTHAVDKGYKILAKAGDDPGVIIDVLVFNKKIIEERPNEIRSIIKSLEDAKRFLKTNRNDSIKIMSEVEGFSYEQMEKSLDDAYRPTLSENLELLQNHYSMLYFEGEEIMQFFYEKNYISRIFSLDQLVYDKFVKELSNAN